MGTWTDAVERARERWNAGDLPGYRAARERCWRWNGEMVRRAPNLDAHADCSSALMYP